MFDAFLNKKTYLFNYKGMYNTNTQRIYFQY